MSFVFTQMTSKPDSKPGAKAFIISSQPPVKCSMWGLVYVSAHVCISAHLRVCMCFYLPNTLHMSATE